MDEKTPIGKSRAPLPPHLQPLIEMLAKSVHNEWMAGRTADGWTFGPRRDDDKKEHPGMVPYENLEEKEKDYDRRSAIETIRTILSLGYRIDKDDRT